MALPLSTVNSILKLVFFSPGLILSIWLFIRQGWKSGAATWRLVLILCLLRIIGASCEIVAIDHPTKDLYATILCCDLVGLAPLCLLCFKLMARV